MTLDPKAFEAADASDLLPCPFCGEAEFLECGGNFVTCKRCAASAYVEEFKGADAVEAIRRWNQRAADLVPRSEFEAAKRLCVLAAETVSNAEAERDEDRAKTEELQKNLELVEYHFDRLTEDYDSQGAQVAALWGVIEWAIERLEVDDGMTAKEQRTTEIRLRHILTITDTAEAAAQYQRVPEGWGVKPLLATAEMCEAAFEAYGSSEKLYPNHFEEIWTAMNVAAPTAGEPEGEWE